MHRQCLQFIPSMRNDLTEVGQDGTEQQTPPCPDVNHIGSKAITMNSKFLYAATVAVSLISSLAYADEAPVSREQVNAELRQAVANGTLQRTDYDTGSYRPQAVTSNVTRQQVAVELAQARQARTVLVGSDAQPDLQPVRHADPRDLDAGAQRRQDRGAASRQGRHAATHRLRRRGRADPPGQPARRVGHLRAALQGEVRPRRELIRAARTAPDRPPPGGLFHGAATIPGSCPRPPPTDVLRITELRLPLGPCRGRAAPGDRRAARHRRRRPDRRSPSSSAATTRARRPRSC